jgi:hypothetical protein
MKMFGGSSKKKKKEKSPKGPEMDLENEEKTTGLIGNAANEIKALRPTLLEAGFNMRGFNVTMTLIPSMTIDIEKVSSVKPDILQQRMQNMQCSLLQKTVLKSMSAAIALDRKVASKGVTLSGIGIQLTVIPTVTARFVFTDDVNKKQWESARKNRFREQARIINGEAKLALTNKPFRLCLNKQSVVI